MRLMYCSSLVTLSFFSVASSLNAARSFWCICEQTTSARSICSSWPAQFFVSCFV